MLGRFKTNHKDMFSLWTPFRLFIINRGISRCDVKAKAYQQLIKLAREELEFDGKIHYLGKTKKIMVLFLFPYLPTLMLFSHFSAIAQI
jgi:hypothetical protein